MSEHRIPRAGGIARVALRELQELGGIASADEWRSTLVSRLSPRQFAERVTSTLKRHGYVEGNDNEYEITDAGRVMLGMRVASAAKSKLQIATPRTAHPFKPLQPRSKSAIVYREGAFDYRNHPSLAGEQRIPYKAGTVTENE